MRRTTWFVLGGLLIALLLAGVASNFASGSPDGLDSASTKGCTRDEAGEITGGDCMARNAADHELGDSPLADYGLRGVDNSFLSTGLAGVIGVLLTFAVGGGVFWLVRQRPPTPAAAPQTPAATQTPAAAPQTPAAAPQTPGGDPHPGRGSRTRDG